MQSPTWATGYRHRTADVEPVAFRFKQTPEDFRVEERPASTPSGTGEHLWLWVEKRGRATIDVARDLARALEREPRDVGFAGRKDVRAVTRQWFSVRGADPEKARGLELHGARVLEVARHERGLRQGQLAGNRFELVLRGLAREARPRVESVLETLAARGLPNYYGAQRFGRGGDTAELGRRLLAGDELGYLEAFLSGEGPAAAELLRLVREGSWRERRAAGELASQLDSDRAAVAVQLARRPKHLGWLVRSVPRRTRRFHLSALQSLVFNRVLVARMEAGALDLWWEGDLVPAESGRGVVPAPEAREPAPLERPATGPVPGVDVRWPTGRQLELEQRALAEEGVDPEALAALPGPLRLPGTRRALRVPVERPSLRFEEDRAYMAFELPTGSYATTLLEELAKEHGSGTTFRVRGGA